MKDSTCILQTNHLQTRMNDSMVGFTNLFAVTLFTLANGIFLQFGAALLERYATLSAKSATSDLA